MRMSIQRRNSIKATLQKLEDVIRHISAKEASSYDHDSASNDHPEQPQSLETYFQMLHRCRKDQSSRKGRYEFWRSFVRAVSTGFSYVEDHLIYGEDVHLLEAHEELKAWFTLNDNKLQSIMARDEDHVNRVDDVSHLVGTGRPAGPV